MCRGVKKSANACIQGQQHIVFILHVHQVHPFQFCLPMSRLPENNKQTMTPPPPYSANRTQEQIVGFTLCLVFAMITTGLILFAGYSAIVAHEGQENQITIVICGDHVYSSKHFPYVNKEACIKYLCHTCRSICECHVIK